VEKIGGGKAGQNEKKKFGGKGVKRGEPKG
jgi:hypothetical protein